mmetsp:Transcript_554/g.1200  ORF Transcript_554/g.1200 Transcript_554/m.1200 type:complete len:327 (+) Transcript_554:843-1823(+)
MGGKDPRAVFCVNPTGLGDPMVHLRSGGSASRSSSSSWAKGPAAGVVELQLNKRFLGDDEPLTIDSLRLLLRSSFFCLFTSFAASLAPFEASLATFRFSFVSLLTCFFSSFSFIDFPFLFPFSYSFLTWLISFSVFPSASILSISSCGKNISDLALSTAASLSFCTDVLNTWGSFFGFSFPFREVNENFLFAFFILRLEGGRGLVVMTREGAPGGGAVGFSPGVPNATTLGVACEIAPNSFSNRTSSLSSTLMGISSFDTSTSKSHFTSGGSTKYTWHTLSTMLTSMWSLALKYTQCRAMVTSGMNMLESVFFMAASWKSSSGWHS